MPRALSFHPIAPALRRRVLTDLRRGLTQGSKTYRRAMRDAQRAYDAEIAAEREMDVTRRLSGGVFALRKNGAFRGKAAHLGVAPHAVPHVVPNGNVAAQESAPPLTVVARAS